MTVELSLITCLYGHIRGQHRLCYGALFNHSWFHGQWHSVAISNT